MGSALLKAENTEAMSDAERLLTTPALMFGAGAREPA